MHVLFPSLVLAWPPPGFLFAAGTICRRVVICVIFSMHGVSPYPAPHAHRVMVLARPKAGLSFRLVNSSRRITREHRDAFAAHGNRTELYLTPQTSGVNLKKIYQLIGAARRVAV